MKQTFIFTLLILLFTLTASITTQRDIQPAPVVIKAATKNSRFGDCLSILFMATYLSLEHQLPLELDHFVYSDQLAIDDYITHQKPLFLEQQHHYTIPLHAEHEIKPYGRCNEPTRYEVDICFKMPEPLNPRLVAQTIAFLKPLIQQVHSQQVAPAHTKDTTNAMHVALHVRKGGGFDLPLCSKDGLEYFPFGQKTLPPQAEWVDGEKRARTYNGFFYRFCKYADTKWPLKFPPDAYYIAQIQNFYHLLGEKPLVMHLFTDDPNPREIATKYTRILQNPNITFTYRETGNRHDQHVVEDFFSIMQCQALIRPASTLTTAAERFGNFQLTASPVHASWATPDQLVIDQVHLSHAC